MAWKRRPKHLSIHLIGPDLPSCTTTQKQQDALHIHYVNKNETAKDPTGDKDTSTAIPSFESLSITCHASYYHEWRQQKMMEETSAPHLLLAYHPGFWGYDTWKPTLEFLRTTKEHGHIPFVVTSYTLLEAEEDEVVLQEMLLSEGGSSNNEDNDHTAKNRKKRVIWSPEYNPFASQMKRPTATAVPGEEYRENSAWQAWWI
jgi:hypothetical protein